MATEGYWEWSDGTCNLKHTLSLLLFGAAAAAFTAVRVCVCVCERERERKFTSSLLVVLKASLVVDFD